MDVLVRALIKSHVPGPRIGKSGCRLEKWHVTASVTFTLFVLELQSVPV